MGWGSAGDTSNAEHILRTTDGGNTWRDVTPIEARPLRLCGPGSGTPAWAFFLDENMAWVIYGIDSCLPTVIWHTQDGGETWSESDPIPWDSSLYDKMIFLDDQIGWLHIHLRPCGTMGCADDVLYATIDGGQTWQYLARTFDGLSSCVKSDLTFINAQTGWMAGHCVGSEQYFLQVTNDGGLTWQDMILPPPPDAPGLFEPAVSVCRIPQLKFLSSQDAVLALSCHYYNWSWRKSWLYLTHDGGQTWVARQAPTEEGALFFVDVNTGWWMSDYGRYDKDEHLLFRTQDGGQTWTLIKRLAWQGELNFLNAHEGWVAAQACPQGNCMSALVKTTDGGVTWQEIHPQIAP